MKRNAVSGAKDDFDAFQFTKSAKPGSLEPVAATEAFGLSPEDDEAHAGHGRAALDFHRGPDLGPELDGDFAKGGVKGGSDGSVGGGKGGGKGKGGGTTDTGGTTDPGGSTDTGGTTDTGGGTGGGGTTYAGDYVSGLDTPNGFNIELVFAGDWTDDLIGSMVRAAEKLSDLITGDLPSFNGIDDIRLSCTLTSIDGSGGVVGSGGASGLRTDSYLPSTGYMRFDSTDAANLFARGMFDSLALHEMIHALGFGKSVWGRLGLVTDHNGDLRFNGANATEAYNAEFANLAANDALAGFGAPVETDGGTGTAGSHWDEALFRTELMTGTLNTTNYLSSMSVAALEDMGYETVYGDTLLVA